MNTNKENMMKNVLVLSFSSVLLTTSAFAVESAQIRVDTRQGLFGGKVATRVEAVGEPDGSNSSVWVTTNEVAGVRDYEDGWLVRRDDGYGFLDFLPLEPGETPDHDVLLLNDPLVVGGRLTTNEVWAADTVRVVRHNVVVPSGVTLTIDPEAPVKFTEEARIVVEDGGRWIAKGSWFAEIADDEWVDGDTNMDGDNSAATGTQDWIAGVDPANYVHVLMLDGAEQVFPTRTYTRGEAYGVLPTMNRYDEGFHFRGWVTNLDETVGVEVEHLADMDQPALYANWEAIYINLSTGLVEFAAYPGTEEHPPVETREIAVGANDKWICSTDAEWLHLSTSENGDNDESRDIHDGVIVVSADVNRSETARSAVIVVSRENGKLVREINVVQAAMEHAEMPNIETDSETTTFTDYMEIVYVNCTTPGVSLYYTTDGSEPSAENGILLENAVQWWDVVEGYFNIYKSMTVKAIAVRHDLLDSAVCTLRITRDSTLAEAIDLDDQYVITDPPNPWTPVRDVTADGVDAARSAPLTVSKESTYAYSQMHATFDGPGTLTFKWKVSCEPDPSGACDLCYLGFEDGQGGTDKIEGEKGWMQSKTYKFTSDGAHTVTWFYRKRYNRHARTGEYRDCGWVDQVVWTPAVFSGTGDDARELYVSPSWLLTVGIVGASATVEQMVEAAGADDDGDGFTNEQEGILGTDPKDPNSCLKANIEMSADGEPIVTFSPENTSNPDYTIRYITLGVANLGDDWKDVDKMDAMQRLDCRFFKIKVDIQKK